ncbi:MAG TPA: 23S rRNA (guanosine(2251)-2'-O)-methyltransferase RlmB [Bacteroidales bacterium]|nr:23S rRNA (guanosine(2251)-2'-O)-methyltransferase RlmB [Bacteroidales bacterium]
MDNNIFGLRPVIEAIKAGKEIDKVFLKNGLNGVLATELFHEIKKRNISMQYVPLEKLDKLCNKNHQGVIAVISPVSYYDLEEIVEKSLNSGKVPLLVILDNITDVRNFGAIARTCECAGVDAIIIPMSNSVRITEDAIKTSAGALYNIPVCRVENIIDAILLLQQVDIEIIAISEKSERMIYETDLKGPVALILGSEESGISSSVLKRANIRSKIPMFGKTESLNVSVSTAVGVYEVIRQRLDT